MVKKVLFMMLLTIGIIISSQVADTSDVSAASCPIRGSDFTYKAWMSLGSLTIRQTFVIENVSNREVYLSVDDFVLRKSGHNTVKPGHWGGGFSKRLDPPLYDKSSYNLYPGDVIGVSLDYDVDDNTAIGWSLCYRNFGNMVVLATIRE